MDLQHQSLEPLERRRIAILGYGNQGRAQALNLRDAGLSPCIGAREGGSAELARRDGLTVLSFARAAEESDVVVFLLPDTIIPLVYRELLPTLAEGKKLVGFAHGYCYRFGGIERDPRIGYFLAAPKGAGSVLRARVEAGSGLPMALAIEGGGDRRDELKEVAAAYARGIGGVGEPVWTTFAEECECDLFGEQSVLCGGLMRLMEDAFETLVDGGLGEEMAFYECVYEVGRIMDLLLEHGPEGMARRISPTALYGGLTRGRRAVGDMRPELRRILAEVRGGEFAREWAEESARGNPGNEAEIKRLRESRWQQTFSRMKEAGKI